MDGGNSAPDNFSQPESLADRLRSLGVQLGTPGLQQGRQPAAKSTYPIESVLEGYDDETAFGKTFIVDQLYTTDYHHGKVNLAVDVDSRTLAEWCKCKKVPEPHLGNCIFLDTETTGLAGGTGTYAFMVGLGYRIESGFRVMQLFMRDPSSEPALIASLVKILEPFDTVISFNGKSFDIPILNTRYVLNGFDTPFPAMDHIDLLSLARRLWKNRLPSRRLGHLEVDILSLNRSEEDVPGELIPYLYFDYIRNGDARPLAGIFYHNAMDILTMAALFNLICGMLQNPFEDDLIHGIDLAAIARMYEEMGDYNGAVQLYEKCLTRDLPIPFFVQTLQRFSLLYRRQGNWDQAVYLWQKTLDYRQGDGRASLDSCIELAKYYEHQQRDYREAQRWATTALELLSDISMPLYQKRGYTQELTRRLERLHKRTGE